MIENAALMQATTLSEQPAWMSSPPDPQDVEQFTAVLNADVKPAAEVTLADNVNPVMAGTDTYRLDSVTIADKILDQFASLDAKYQELFPEGVNYKVEQNAESYFTTDGISANSAISQLLDMSRQTAQVSLWSTQISLMTSGISKGTQGVQTLFRNSG